ncbi:MAG: hypothetical protein ACRDPM_19000 [Solirubrobacteraceae bacterium]
MLELDAANRPAVFVGPYEDHSSELPWRESPADLVTTGQDREGRVGFAWTLGLAMAGTMTVITNLGIRG